MVLGIKVVYPYLFYQELGNDSLGLLLLETVF